MKLLIVVLLLSLTNIDNESAIRFLDCTFADTKNNYSFEPLYASTNDTILISGRKLKADENDNTYLMLNMVSPIRKSFKLIIDTNVAYKGRVYNMIYKNNKLYFITAEDLYEFRFSNNEFKFQRKIEFEYFHEFLDYENDKLYISTTMHHDNLPYDSLTHIKCLNVKTNKLENTYYFPPPEGIRFTKLKPRKVIDYKKGNILIADITSYKINIYTLEGELLNSIHRDVDCFVSEEKENHSGRVNPRGLMKAFKERCLISNANFIYDDLIMVTYQKPSPDENSYYQTKHDLWELKGNKWELIQQDLSFDYDPQSSFHPEKFGFTSSYIIDDNIISATVVKIPFELNESYYDMTMEEFVDSAGMYVIDNEPRFSIIKYKVER